MALITEPTLNPATLTPATAVSKTPATDQYATFKSYLEMLFAPTDHIFIQLIHSTKTHKDERGNDVKDTRLLALRPRDEVSSPSSHKELQKFEVEGWNVYVCMTLFQPQRRVVGSRVLRLYAICTSNQMEKRTRLRFSPPTSMKHHSAAQHHTREQSRKIPHRMECGRLHTRDSQADVEGAGGTVWRRPSSNRFAPCVADARFSQSEICQQAAD